ncbi:MAG: hypothetical protein ACRET6_09965 [Burkholderiales bacterium]
MDGGRAPVNGQLRPLQREEISEPGAYVNIATGALYRVPAGALHKRVSAATWKETADGSRFVLVSRNPYIISLEARIICAANDIRFDF